MLFLADGLYSGGSILAHAENSVIFVAIVGSVMTCVYVVGLMERRNRTVFGVGWDSAAALLLYGGSMTVLYFIR